MPNYHAIIIRTTEFSYYVTADDPEEAKKKVEEEFIPLQLGECEIVSIVEDKPKEFRCRLCKTMYDKEELEDDSLGLRCPSCGCSLLEKFVEDRWVLD